MGSKKKDSTPAEELAKLLDGHELRQFDAVVAIRQKPAALLGLVVVFGASDDLMEFRGAIDGEVGMSEHERIPAYIAGGKILTNECDERDDCPYFPALRDEAFKVEGLWCAEESPTLAWTYRLDVAHASFTIIEDGEPWCRGVVFALADAPGIPGVHAVNYAVPTEEDGS